MSDIDEMTVADLVERVARLEARTRDLEEENRVLREAQTVSTPDGPHEPTATVPPDEATPGAGVGAAVGRRSVLSKGLAAAAGVAAGAVVLEGSPAAAANGDPVRIGQTNAGTSPTVLTGSSLYTSVTSGISLWSGSTTGLGTLTTGGRAEIQLGGSSSRVPPMRDTTAHSRGEMVHDQFGVLWFCTASGTPGTWRSVVGNNGAGAFFPFLSPQRAYDSRPGTVPAQGPKTKLPANTTRTISLFGTIEPLAGQVTAVLLNVLLVNATSGNGNFTVWAAGTSAPQSNTMVWGGSAGRFSTLAFSRVDPSGRVNIRASLATDVVLDVVGHYS